MKYATPLVFLSEKKEGVANIHGLSDLTRSFFGIKIADMHHELVITSLPQTRNLFSKINRDKKNISIKKMDRLNYKCIAHIEQTQFKKFKKSRVKILFITSHLTYD